MNKISKIALGSLVATLIATGTAQAAEGWARSSSWLRAGPGTSYPTLTRVSAGESLSVHGCLRRWSWCDVSVDGERGWFPGRRIALLRDGRRVELPVAAAVLGLSILAFERNAYWHDHYRGRPFYDGRPPHRPGGWNNGRPDRPPMRPMPPRPVESRPDHRMPSGAMPAVPPSRAQRPPIERRDDVRRMPRPDRTIEAPTRRVAPPTVDAGRARMQMPAAPRGGMGGAPGGRPGCLPGAC